MFRELPRYNVCVCLNVLKHLKSDQEIIWDKLIDSFIFEYNLLHVLSIPEVGNLLVPLYQISISKSKLGHI